MKVTKPGDAMAECKQLVRIQLEYDDGKISTLEGKQAAAWLKQADDIFALAQITKGIKIEQFDWEKSEKSKSQ